MDNKKRLELKRWSTYIMKKLLGKDTVCYEDYKMSIVAIFSTVLFSVIDKDNKMALDQKDSISSSGMEKYKRIVNQIYLLNKIKTLDLQSIYPEVFESIVEFAYEYCNSHLDSVENILAWLYQYLNINDDSNLYKDTQFFTEDYMLNYLVSSGIEEFNDCKQLKVIDPACGGGNFLTYAIESLYNKNLMTDLEFIDFVCENIYGYDIDKNLSVITVINIYLKLLHLQILNLDEIDKYTLRIYHNQGEFGSLSKTINTQQLLVNVSSGEYCEFSNIFCKQYDLLITNPPFKGRRDMDGNLREYLRIEYPESSGDLCSAFLLRSLELVKPNGIISVVLQNNWMYLESFKDLRKRLLETGDIQSIVDLGTNAFSDLTGEKTNVCLLNYKISSKKDSFKVYRLKNLSYKDKVLRLVTKKFDSELTFEIMYRDLTDNNYYRMEYLSFGKIRQSFEFYPKYGEFAKPMQGTSTGDTSKYVCYQWENQGDPNWILVSKGGGYCKWQGLNIYKVNWGVNGEIINSSPNAVIRNAQYFDKTDLVYSDTGTSGLNVRLLLNNQIFIASGPGIMVLRGNKYAHLALLNSRLASYYIKILSPKLTISATYIAHIPTKEEVLIDSILIDLSKECVEYKNRFNMKRPINFEFKHNNYLKYGSIYEYAIADFKDDLNLELKRLENEYKINERIFDLYAFSENEKLHIYNEVGYNPYTINTNPISLSTLELDRIVSKNLDNNCIFNASRINKTVLGSEGILEYFATSYGFNPLSLYRYFINQIHEYPLIINRYIKHTLHKYFLYQNNKLICEGDNIFLPLDINSIDIGDKEIEFEVINWFNSEIQDFHSQSFKNKPIIQKRGRL